MACAVILTDLLLEYFAVRNRLLDRQQEMHRQMTIENL
jgi:hypothetical protein